MLTEQDYLTVYCRYAGKFKLNRFGSYEGEPTTTIGLPSPQLIIQGVHNIRGTTATHFAKYLYDFVHHDTATSLPSFRPLKTSMFKFDMTEEQFKALVPSDFIHALVPANCDDPHEGIKQAFEEYAQLVRHLTSLYYILALIIHQHIMDDITDFINTFMEEHQHAPHELYDEVVSDAEMWAKYWQEHAIDFFPESVIAAAKINIEYTFSLQDGKLHIAKRILPDE
jgi:hypothetical protein